MSDDPVLPSRVTLPSPTRHRSSFASPSKSIAVIPLEGKDAYTATALIPTAYSPKDVTFSADGTYMYIVNGLSHTGPNPGYRSQEPSILPNQYQFALEQARPRDGGGAL